MIDALEAVVMLLRTDADLNVLTAGRVAARHKFGDGWDIPSKAVQVRLDGGRPDLYVEVQNPRLEIRCYGESQYEAGKVYRELVRISRAAVRARVETNSGAALIYWLNMVSGPSFLFDEDAGVQCVLVFAEASVSEVDIP